MYFAAAAILYEVVLVPNIPGAPPLAQIIGVIGKSTGALWNNIFGTSLVALIYVFTRLYK